MNRTKKNILKNIPIKKPKTVKSRAPSRNAAIKQIYKREYYGRNTLPITDIIHYINASFNDYMSMKEIKSESNLPAASFEDFFIVDDNLVKKENSADIDIKINKNPNASLDKLLAYSLYYSEYKNWFNSPNKNMDMSLFKFQTGKDLSRIDITINNKKYKSNDNDDNNLKTDKFNVEIMNVFSEFSIIDFNLINKIDICMCQNILNFVSDIISLAISKKIVPEKFVVTRAEKSLLINLTKSQENIIYNFETRFYITKGGALPDPEFTCGNMSFIFVIDLKKNTYNFEKFKLNYDDSKCIEEVIQNYQGRRVKNTESKTNETNETNGSSNVLKYIPVAAGIGGIIATPFLLGALGGKNKKNRKNKLKKNKTKKLKRRKKSFYK